MECINLSHANTVADISAFCDMCASHPGGVHQCFPCPGNETEGPCVRDISTVVVGGRLQIGPGGQLRQQLGERYGCRSGGGAGGV